MIGNDDVWAKEDCRPAGASLRVCMLVACPFPANHGTPGSIREMSEAIADEGHDVHIVTYHIGENLPVRGSIVHRIPALTGEKGVVVGPTVRRPLYDLQMVFKALEVIWKHQPDLLHAHGYEAALVGWLCRLATGIPVIYSGHMTMGDELASYNFIKPAWLAKPLANFLDSFIPRIGDRCLPHSSNIARFFQRKGLSHRAEPVVNFGIDLDWMQQGEGAGIRERLGLGDGPIVLYSGVLDRFQRMDLLLEAVANLRHHEPNVKLLIVTTISHQGHEASLRAQAKALKIEDNLVITETQTLEGVRDLLQICDVAVVPRPNAAGFPIKLLNYMAASRPCVLFASSASKGLEHGINAYLVPEDSSEAFGLGILEVLRDVSLRERIGREGHHFVRKHHDRKMVARKICGGYFRTLAKANRLGPVLRRRPKPENPASNVPPSRSIETMPVSASVPMNATLPTLQNA